MTEVANIFEQATRQVLRFDSPIGQLTVEDLWTLPLSATRANKPNLDDIAVALNKQLKGTEESFVSNKKKDAILQLKFDIVKRIITVRMEENEAKTAEVQKASKREKLDELIAKKQDEKLENLSVEELQAMKDAL